MAIRPAPVQAPEGTRRYPVVGGPAAWGLAVLAGLVVASAAAFKGLDAAAPVAALAWLVHRLSRSVVVETSPGGLTRGLLAVGAFRARPTVIAWPAVVEVRTTWRRPHDDSALETVVRDREGRSIRLSTAMGLGAYWACLAEIVQRAPAAARAGLTDGVLADGPPDRRDLVAGLRAAAALALVLGAVVAIHYVWAQGRSSLARDFEQASTASEPRR